MDPMTPGEVARRAGTLHRIRFIKRAQALGFSLEEIRELLSLRKDLPEDCANVVERVDAKLRDVRTRIADLQRIQRALAILREECCTSPAEAPCPVLTSLEDEPDA